MTSLTVFQITALMFLLYSIKVKMWKINKIGFFLILGISIVSTLISIFPFEKNDYESFMYVFLSLFLALIAIFNTYKKYVHSKKDFHGNF